MCGITGIVSNNTELIDLRNLDIMSSQIAHRGPNGKESWISDCGKVGFAHRRLSIIDLSQDANQPMHYSDRYTIVFNGEIYNYLELKETLTKQGYAFRTKSDTEVLMAMYHKYGLDCLQLLDGMFSFVLYDSVDNEIFCARDRFGEKPFFYSYEPGKYFYFGSEMKSLWAAGIPKKINERMLFNYMTLKYLSNPQDLSETFYTNCTRLVHSHYIKFRVNDISIIQKKYYDIDWRHTNESINLSEAKDTFKELFYTSVNRRLRSDVTIGSSLSGGLDSSLVVCAIDDLQRGKNSIQNTFSAVFPGFEKDERKYIDYVTNTTNVKPYFVTPRDFEMQADLDKLLWHQEEPIESASVYVLYRVMQLADAENVTVLLDGQGADEILGGYHHYYTSYFNEIKNKANYNSEYTKYRELHAKNEINNVSKKSVGGIIREIAPSLVRPAKQLKLASDQIFNPLLSKDFYNTYKSEMFQSFGFEFQTLNEALYNNTMRSGSLQELLRYADRNSMAFSKEVRLPFLYHEMVEFLFSLPASMKINQGWTKWIMRETFSELLPQEIAYRIDKIGCEPPQQRWMSNRDIREKLSFIVNDMKNKNYLNKKFDLIRNNDNLWQVLMYESLM